MERMAENKLMTSTLEEKKREKEKKIDGTITLSLSLKAIICYIDDH
jgi:hypothetical protein